MLTIFLTRHGETEWNKENRLQGWGDSNLTEKGIADARQLGKRLEEVNINKIYSSPSSRAMTTALEVRNGRDIPIIATEGLKEIHLGDWEGKTKEEIVVDYEQEFYHFWNSPQHYNHTRHRGEGLTAFISRVEDTLKRIITENHSGNVLLVTHAVVIKAIFLYILDIPLEKMWDSPFIHGTSLTIIDWDGQNFDVKMHGDMSHVE